eukprot:TRINITY_DN9434_c0_g1_i1.p1 TRINITY_DN9434_c0_g1~~TRINITY_DN9434_c0_g1_i1.p1  ORF type:complete len:267 (-),score=58.79 TRINITY_DN9434_c0_g1_i1:84-851(-)
MEEKESELNTKFSTRKVWLVKVPNFLADAWTNGAPPNANLGKVEVTAQGQTLVNMKLLLEGSYAKDLPKSYRMNPVRTGPTNIYSFSEGDSEGITMEGCVESKYDTTPDDTGEYRTLMRNRVQKSNIKLRTTQVIEEEAEVTEKTFAESTRKRKEPEKKREKMSEDELTDELFSIFEKGTYYDIKTLVNRTGQPTMFLKSLLDKLCDYNKRGPNKGMYQLKTQYRKRTGTTPAPQTVNHQSSNHVVEMAKKQLGL